MRNTHYLFKCFLGASIVIFSGCSNVDLSNGGKIYINDADHIIQHDLSNYNIKVNTVYTAPNKNSIVYLDVLRNQNVICFTAEDLLESKVRPCLILLKENRQDTIISPQTYKISYPSFSPDGNKIAFLFCGGVKPKVMFKGYYDAACAIYDIQKRSYETITDTILASGKPSWSQDGCCLYVSTFEGKMVRMDLNGSVLDTIGDGYYPTLSPDGKKLAYTHGRSIFVMDLDSKRKKRIASKGSFYIPQEPQYLDLTWSPDSKYILYQGQYILAYITGWSSQYVVVSAEGKGLPRQIDNETARGFGAAWVTQ
jgi:Tol biopolymer transport system component